jgi:Fe-S-cluster containining protein
MTSTERRERHPVEIAQRDRATAQVVVACYRWMDRRWGQLLDMVKTDLSVPEEDKAHVACTRGCAACCSYLVDCLEAEGITIAIAIEQTGGQDRLQVLRRLLAWEHEFNAWQQRNPMPEPITVLPDRGDGQLHLTNNPAHLAWRTRWQFKRKACPFLNLADYSCSIYDIRPATCRGHHAAYLPKDAPPDIRQPPEGCFTSAEDLARGRPCNVWQINNMLGEEWTVMLGENLHRNRLPWDPGLVLPLAVLKAGRARFGWPGPTDVGTPVPTMTEARKEQKEEESNHAD